MIGRIAAARRRLASAADPPSLAWRLRGLRVCASTERELEHWLQRQPPAPGQPLVQPRAVLAAHQRFGHGQQGRPWQAPPGGVWISAALPWTTVTPSSSAQGDSPTASPAAVPAAALGLAVAVGLAQELEALGLAVRLKWPNDLLVVDGDGTPRKLAGLLPRLRWRGGVSRWAQVGVGLNGRNRVPAGAISLAQALGGRSHPAADPLALAARVLRALEWAVAHGGLAEAVRQQAERRLWWDAQPLPHQGSWWWVEGLAADGGLRLRSGLRHTTLHRRF